MLLVLGPWTSQTEFFEGVFARRHGEQEEDAAAVPGHGVVDAPEATAVAAPAASPAVRAPEMGRHERRGGDGDNQGPAAGAKARH